MAKFQKGQSGNPGGRPVENEAVKALARNYTKEAIDKLVEIMRSDDIKTARAAAENLLDRAWGKPAQMLAGDPENPMRHVFGWMKE